MILLPWKNLFSLWLTLGGQPARVGWKAGRQVAIFIYIFSTHIYFIKDISQQWMLIFIRHLLWDVVEDALIHD